MLSLYARMFKSSTKPKAVTLLVSNIGRRVNVKKRNRMGKSVDPYGIPVYCGLTWSMNSPSLRHVVLS
jgi:hypothetical protein